MHVMQPVMHPALRLYKISDIGVLAMHTILMLAIFFFSLRPPKTIAHALLFFASRTNSFRALV